MNEPILTKLSKMILFPLTTFQWDENVLLGIERFVEDGHLLLLVRHQEDEVTIILADGLQQRDNMIAYLSINS